MNRTTASQFAKFVLNGLVANAVHYAVLSTLIELFRVPSAGVSNFIAATFGISASFIGNRVFVFANRQDRVLHHAWRFGALYSVIACLHALILYVWSDRLGLDYRVGFVLASGLLLIVSFAGNKYMVFRS